MINAGTCIGRNVEALAREHLGTQFVHQGRSAELGIDCVGLLVLIAQELGRTVFDESGYRRTPDPEQLVAKLDENLLRVAGENLVDFDEIETGDVLLFWIRRKARPQHVAVVSELEDGRPGMIHTYYNIGRVVEHGFEDRWRRRTWGVWRFE